MKKTVNICGYDIEVAVNAASLLIYKKAFHRDGFQDMLKLGKFQTNIENQENIDFDFVYRFLWVFAYCANKEIPPYEDYFMQFEVAPVDFLTEATEVVINLLAENAAGTVKARKKSKTQTSNQ
jgi:hypothetical protein